MLHLPRWKVFMVLGTLLLCAYIAIPNLFVPSARDSLPWGIPKQGVSLGLDLQGGSHLLMEVDTGKLRDEQLTNLAEDVRTALRARDAKKDQKPILFNSLRPEPLSYGVSLNVSDPVDLPEALKRLEALSRPVGEQGGGSKDLAITSTPEGRIELRKTPEAQDLLIRRAVAQSIEVVRRRVDNLGTKETTIVRQGRDRIVIQVPGEGDPERIKSMIGKTAKLTFQEVVEVAPEDAAAGLIPPGVEVLPNEEGGFLAVRKRAVVSGDELVDAGLSQDEFGRPAVSFRFNSSGGRKFAAYTGNPENYQRRFAIVLDGKIISAPAIQSAILGGSGIITGSFTSEEASGLASLLRAGALPAPLNVIEQRTIGPELGADSIRAGAISVVAALVISVVFMGLMYGLFGFFAFLALLANLLLMIAAMSMMGATLTLPGVAGFILSLGAAIDGAILIYERMREEQAAGRNAASALRSGFDRAVGTILDANITTALAAGLLLGLGAGPVKGFAVTLLIGTFTSVFAAVFVIELLLATWFQATKPKSLPI